MTNEELAVLILKADPDARAWVYNRYCGYCARFLYPEDVARGRCKKCNTKTDNAIGRPLPFLTSGTAIEKLIIWVRDMARDGKIPHSVFEKMYDAIDDWMSSRQSNDDFHQALVDAVGGELGNTKSGFNGGDSGH